MTRKFFDQWLDLPLHLQSILHMVYNHFNLQWRLIPQIKA